MNSTSPATLTWMMALASVLLSAFAQLSLKVGMTGAAARPSLATVEGLRATLFNPYVFAGLACYGVSAMIWLSVLSKMPLSMAYPLVALAIAIVVIASGVFLGETLPLARLAGVALVVVGVVLIGFRS
jgi:multidrug transporter EmrE-like cation transporter